MFTLTKPGQAAAVQCEGPAPRVVGAAGAPLGLPRGSPAPSCPSSLLALTV